MSFLDIFKRKSAIGTRLVDAGISLSGADNYLSQDATAWAAIDLISSALANLTGSFYNSITKQAVSEHYLYDLMKFPNQDETKFQFMYSSVNDYFTSGNVYWYKYDSLDGNIVALFRLNPNKVAVKRNNFNQKVYMYDGKEYYSDKILHIPARFGYNGLVGKSIFSECSNVFRTSAELDIYVNNSFNNNVGNRLVIDITKQYPDATKEQIEELRSLFLQNYTGIKNAGKPLIKTGKIEYDKIDTQAKDNKANQLIENRQFQEKEIAKLFGIPISLMSGGEVSGSIESLYILFIENAIKPIATQFEQSINKLIPTYERSKLYFEFSYNSLMKTTLESRINAYVRQLSNGILTVNEVRRKENLAEVTDAANNLFIPANLMPLTNEVVDSYMAKSKLTLQQLNETSPNTNGNHDNKGDDKI